MNYAKHWSWICLLLLGACGEAEVSECFPAKVQAIFDAKCQQCHNDKLEFGAPMSLDRWNEIQQNSSQGNSMLEEIGHRVRSAKDPMPPRGVSSLSASELSEIESWITEGGPKGAMGCFAE